MNKKIRTFISGTIMSLVLVAAMPAFVLDAFAASAKIAFSDPSVSTGEEVSVNMKFSSTSGQALGNTDTMLSYDTTMLEYVNETENASGGAGSIRVWTGSEGKTEMTTVLRFKALQAGTTQITVSTWEAYDNDGQMLTMDKEGSSTVTIKSLATSSTDATLKTLKISPGVLSPAFTPATESYTTTVGLDTEKLAVSANVNNEKAKVVVEGGTELQQGENTVTCKVTAEDGTTTKNYTIIVNKIEGGETAAAAEETTVADETAATEEVLAELNVAAKTIRIIAPEEGVSLPEGFKESTIAIGDTKVQGWIWSEDEAPKYCVFYGMNDNGEKNFYCYDLAEKTVQRYFGSTAEVGTVSEEQYVQLANDYNNLIEDFMVRKYILWGLSALTVLLLILVIALLAKKGGKGNDRPKRGQDTARDSRRAEKTSGRKVSREERYMLGEEDELEEDYDDSYVQDEPESRIPVEQEYADLDRKLAADLAKETKRITDAPKVEEGYLDDEDDDDFELIDLDD